MRTATLAEMKQTTIEPHGPLICTVEVSPSEIDAGGESTVRIIATCPHGCDLTGHIVSIRDAAGEELAQAQLAEADDDDSYCSPQIGFKVPERAGRHDFTVMLPALDKDGCSHEAAAAEFSVLVKAHAVYLNVWGIPATIPAGGKISVKIGMKCSSGCCLAGRELEIVDTGGAPVGIARLGAESWPGTAALYVAQFEADAPAEPGDWKWSAKFDGNDDEMPHAEGEAAFTTRTVPRPDHVVTVETVDSESKRPIRGLHVWMHPYRGVTDEHGIACLNVAKGTYKLHVSGFNYIGHQSVVEAAKDVAVRVELIVQPVDEEANWH